MTMAECEWCGDDFEQNKTGRPRKTCSEACNIELRAHMTKSRKSGDGKKVRHLVVVCDDPGAKGPCPKWQCRYNILGEHHAWDHRDPDPDRPDTGKVRRKWHFSEWPKQQQKELADALKHTCALYWADAGGLTLNQVGVLLGFTREWARKIEVAAVQSIATDAAFVEELKGVGASTVNWYGDGESDEE